MYCTCSWLKRTFSLSLVQSFFSLSLFSIIFLFNFSLSHSLYLSFLVLWKGCTHLMKNEMFILIIWTSFVFFSSKFLSISLFSAIFVTKKNFISPSPYFSLFLPLYSLIFLSIALSISFFLGFVYWLSLFVTSLFPNYKYIIPKSIISIIYCVYIPYKYIYCYKYCDPEVTVNIYYK